MSEPSNAQPVAPIPQLITYAQLTEALQLSRQSIGAMIADGRLPKPYPFGAHAVRFNADEVREAMERLRRDPPKIALRPRGKHARMRAKADSASDLL